MRKVYCPAVRDFRVRALRRALATSIFVPLVAGALWLAQAADLRLPEEQVLSGLLLALSGMPTVLNLITAAVGHPWDELERDWAGLPSWQRAMSSTVALICGLTTGAAVVLIVLGLVEIDAKAREEAPHIAPPASYRP